MYDECRQRRMWIMKKLCIKVTAERVDKIYIKDVN